MLNHSSAHSKMYISGNKDIHCPVEKKREIFSTEIIYNIVSPI